MKKWYQSKTIWANLIAAIAFFAQAEYGFIIAPELQAIALTVINGVLRMVTTKAIST